MKKQRKRYGSEQEILDAIDLVKERAVKKQNDADEMEAWIESTKKDPKVAERQAGNIRVKRSRVDKLRKQAQQLNREATQKARHLTGAIPNRTPAKCWSDRLFSSRMTHPMTEAKIERGGIQVGRVVNNDVNGMNISLTMNDFHKL